MLRFYNKRQDDGLLQLLFGMSLIVFVVSAIFIGQYMLKSIKNTNIQNDIIERIDDDATQVADGQLVDRYEKLRGEYPHLKGRLIIQNGLTKNDLVVMQTDDNEYYLHRDSKGNYSDFGTAYFDYRNNLENMTDNYIIYAHSMKNGTQFGCLKKYKSKEYWEKYPTVTLETMYDEPYKYEIVGVFYDRVYKPTDTVFKYYNFIDPVNEEEFMEYINHIKKRALYDTGITPKYGEQLLTLSTCDKSVITDGSGRFVLVARKKSGRIPGNLMGDSSSDENSDEDSSGDIEEQLEEEQPTATPTPTVRPTPRPKPSPTPKPKPTPTVAPTPDPTPEPAPTQEPEPTIPPEDYDTMTISPQY